MIRTAIAMAAIAIAAPALAAEEKPFTQAEFAAAQAAGRPVLVDVAAWWCPVCASQGRSIKAITASPAYAKLLILKVNYDGQKDVWRGLGVTKQATLIAYRGRQEVGRIAFQTDRAQIGALLASAVR
jgi:thioredoxin 1